MEEKAKEVAKLLKVLANESRLLLLCFLLESPETVGSLQNKLNNISQSAVSQHLAILKAHGIVDSEKRGVTITYAIADQRVLEVINVIKRFYC